MAEQRDPRPLQRSIELSFGLICLGLLLVLAKAIFDVWTISMLASSIQTLGVKHDTQIATIINNQERIIRNQEMAVIAIARCFPNDNNNNNK